MFLFQEEEGEIYYYVVNLVGYFIGYFITSLYYLLYETCRRDGDSGSESDVSPMRGRRPKSSVEPWYENQWNETMQG